MNKKRDIESRNDITLLVHSFYGIALKDAILGPVFKAAKMDMDKHLPTIITFWESILLDKANYRGNPMLVHLKLHRHYPLDQSMFQIWLQLWKESVAKHFDGKRAQMAIDRADSIAKLMMHKINQTE